MNVIDLNFAQTAAIEESKTAEQMYNEWFAANYEFAVNTVKSLTKYNYEDLALEVMTKFWEKGYYKDSEKNNRGFLRTALFNAFKNEYKKQNESSQSAFFYATSLDFKTDDNRALSEVLADESGNFTENKALNKVNSLLEQIKNPKHRKAVSLRLQGFSYDEIAAEMNTPKQTVKSNVRRGKLALVNIMQELGLDTENLMTVN